jgi:hypothetical protein
MGSESIAGLGIGKIGWVGVTVLFGPDDEIDLTEV